MSEANELEEVNLKDLLKDPEALLEVSLWYFGGWSGIYLPWPAYLTIFDAINLHIVTEISLHYPVI
jgi:hypothetical protein